MFVVPALGILALILFVRTGVVDVPDEVNPWAPLRIDAKPDLLTRVKLDKLSDDRLLCRSVLATSKLQYDDKPDSVTGDGCGFKNAVSIKETAVDVGKPFSLTCRAAVSFALWEKHSLQPAAIEELGSPIVRIHHMGSYSCRNYYHRKEARRSRHATAEAVDISGFVLEDGTDLRIAKYWPKKNAREESAEARFLRRVHREACSYFDVVLGPEYNRAHRDHFHLDRGPYRACR